MASNTTMSHEETKEEPKLPWSTQLILAPGNTHGAASEDDEGEPVKLEQGNLFELPENYQPESPSQPTPKSPLPAPRSPQPAVLSLKGSASSGVKKRKSETEHGTSKRKIETRLDDDEKVGTGSSSAKADNRPTFEITQSTNWNRVDHQFEMNGVGCKGKLRFIDYDARKHSQNLGYGKNCTGLQNGSRRPDCIDAPEIGDWAPLLLEKCTCGGYVISSALRVVFLSFKVTINNQAKERGRKLANWILKKINASGQRIFWERIHESISLRHHRLATSLTATIHRKQAFGFLLGNSPPIVVREMALHQRGSFISTELVIPALKQMNVSIVDGTLTSTRFVADSCANIVESSFRNSSKDNATLKARLESVIKDTISSIQASAKKDWDKGVGRDVDMEGTDGNEAKETEQKIRRKAIKQVAVVFGLLVSGTLKWVLKVAQDKKQEKENIALAINVVTSLIGVAAHGTEIASGLIGLMANAALDYFWVDPSKGLHVLVQDCVTDWVYVPLAVKSTLPKILDPAPGLNELDQEEKAIFKEWFELMLRACHLL